MNNDLFHDNPLHYYHLICCGRRWYCTELWRSRSFVSHSRRFVWALLHPSCASFFTVFSWKCLFVTKRFKDVAFPVPCTRQEIRPRIHPLCLLHRQGCCTCWHKEWEQVDPGVRRAGCISFSASWQKNLTDRNQAEGDPITDPGELSNHLFRNMASMGSHSWNRCAHDRLLFASTAC